MVDAGPRNHLICKRLRVAHEVVVILLSKPPTLNHRLVRPKIICELSDHSTKLRAQLVAYRSGR